jgi:hypothetical protein
MTFTPIIVANTAINRTVKIFFSMLKSGRRGYLKLTC